MHEWVRGGLAAAAAMGLLTVATPASPTVMLATYTGTVSGGYDITDVFGLNGDFAGVGFKAVFKYDSTLGLVNPDVDDGRIGGPTFGGVSPILAATLEINGVTDTFDTFEDGAANVYIGEDTWEQTFHYTGAFYVDGPVWAENFLQLFVLSAPTPTLLTTPYAGGNKTFNEGPKETNKAGYFRKEGATLVKDYKLSLETDRVVVRPAPVPEPATWTVLITGFVGVGLMLRRRRARLA